MIGTLLDDVIAGMPFETIKRRWDAKMNPLQYQRPTAISDGNIEQANKIVAKLGSEGSLARRFARFEDVLRWEWLPKETDYLREGRSGEMWSDGKGPELTPYRDGLWWCQKCHQEYSSPGTCLRCIEVDRRKGGAFDHLKSKSQTVKPVQLPAKPMKWTDFAATVLPHAKTVEVDLPQAGAYFAMTTAVNADAPPILQWDGLTVPNCTDYAKSDVSLPRNPVCWYFPHPWANAIQWNLSAGWTKVDGICLKPCHWQREFPHQGGGVFFVIKQAKDQRGGKSGSALFPETMKSEYHSIRHAIEAYSRSAELEGREDATACGIALRDQGSLTVRVNGGDTYQLSP